MPDPHDEAVGATEPCDWCGRPGTVFQHDFWEGDTLVARNPSLCGVCMLIWESDTGAVSDLLAERSIDTGDRITALLLEFKRRWREKVEAGHRQPQQPNERSGIHAWETRP